MAAKMISDSAGLVLGWCEALDRRERAARAESSASAEAARASARAREKGRAELAARHKEELRLAEQSHDARLAEAARGHALAVASLLEGREALGVAAASAVAAARGRRDATRVLAAWREAVGRARRAEANVARARERRRERALREWRSRAAALRASRAAEAAASTALARRGLRRALGGWARTVARRRLVAERRLAGARLVVEAFRRSGPLRRCFDTWQAASRDVLVARQALEQEAAEEEREALVAEVSPLLSSRGFALYVHDSSAISEDNLGITFFLLFCEPVLARRGSDQKRFTTCILCAHENTKLTTNSPACRRCPVWKPGPSSSRTG